jgi:hypothetical protein
MELFYLHLHRPPSFRNHIYPLDCFEYPLGAFQRSRGHVGDGSEAGEQALLLRLIRQRYWQALDSGTAARHLSEGNDGSQ